MSSQTFETWVRSVVTQHEGALVRYVAGMIGIERARDVVQEAFMTLLRQERSAVEAKVKAWLYTVCRNRALDVIRKERRMEHHGDAEWESGQKSPAESLEERQDLSRVKQSLADLPTNQREVIRLKFQDGLSYREISDVTGLSVSNVGYLLHVGIRALRRELSGDDVVATEGRTV